MKAAHAVGGVALVVALVSLSEGPVQGASFRQDVSTGLLAWWKMDSDTPNPVDATGNGYDGFGRSDNGGPMPANSTTVPPALSSFSTGSMSFTRASQQYVAVADAPALDFATTGASFTLSAWVNPVDDNTQQYGIMEKWTWVPGPPGYASDGYMLRLYSNRGAHFAICGPSGPSAGIDGPVVPAGAWTHLAAVYEVNPGLMHLYVNGSPVGTTASSPPTAGTADLQIGAGQGYQFFPGLIDDVRVYSRALTQADVQAIVAGGQPSTTPPPPPPPPPGNPGGNIRDNDNGDTCGCRVAPFSTLPWALAAAVAGMLFIRRR